MTTFKEFILLEADPMAAPGGGAPGIASPANMGGGGAPMMGGGGPMGGAGGPPMGGGGGPMGGMPGLDPMGGGGMGGPPQQAPPVQVKFMSVWDVLERILDGKPINKKSSGHNVGDVLKNVQQQTTNTQQPPSTGATPSGLSAAF